MGSTDFSHKAKGNNAKDAFLKAREEAMDEYGNRAYSGSIKEKRDYVMIPLPPGKDPLKYAYELLNDEDPRVNDKYGPAGCFDLGNGEYLFFGFASC